MAIGISLASLLPYSAIFPRRAANWAMKEGYQFIQVLPFRFVNPLRTWPLPASYMEKAWNPAYTESGPDPSTPITIYDRLFFPSPKKCVYKVQLLFTNFAVPHLIVHHWYELARGRTLLEVSPGLWQTPQKIIKELIILNNLGKRLVLDLYHLRRPPRSDEPGYLKDGKSFSRLGDWRVAIEILLPATRLIHVSPHRETDELVRFLAGEETELEKMLRFIKVGGFEGDWVVEATLGIGGLQWWKLKKTMKRFRERLGEILEE